MRSHFMSRMKIEATVNLNFIIVSEANCSYPTNTFIVKSKLKSDMQKIAVQTHTLYFIFDSLSRNV